MDTGFGIKLKKSVDLADIGNDSPILTIERKDHLNKMRTKEELGFKRIHERKLYVKEVVFSHNHKAYSGQIKNISLGGAFITTRSVKHFSPGDTVTLSIPFTTGKKHVKRNGLIKWLNDEGIAIEFF